MSKIPQIKIPLNLISETPTYWVILKIPYKEETIYKVFGGWGGGYLDGDRWKLNSGIVKVTEDEDYYYFYGYSGSCYQCHKKGYGIKEGMWYFTVYVQRVLDSILEKLNNENINAEILDENTDWLKLNINEN